MYVSRCEHVYTIMYVHKCCIYVYICVSVRVRVDIGDVYVSIGSVVSKWYLNELGRVLDYNRWWNKEKSFLMAMKRLVF